MQIQLNPHNQHMRTPFRITVCAISIVIHVPTRRQIATVMIRMRRIRFAASAMGAGLLVLAHTVFAPSINTPRKPMPLDLTKPSHAVLTTINVYSEYDDTVGTVPSTTLMMTSPTAADTSVPDGSVWPAYYYWGAAYIILVVAFNLVAELWFEYEYGQHLISRLWNDLWSGRLFVWLFSALPAARQPLAELDPAAAAAAAVVPYGTIPARRRRPSASVSANARNGNNRDQQQPRSHGSRWWWWRLFGPQLVNRLRTWTNRRRRNVRPVARPAIDYAAAAGAADGSDTPEELEMAAEATPTMTTASSSTSRPAVLTTSSL